MSEQRTVRTLGVAGPGRPDFFTYNEQPPEDDEFWVDTVYTGLSAGTELTFVKGTNPYLRASWNAERGVFVEGEPSYRYPIESLGYMEVGRVIETRTPAVAIGDLVALNYGHRSGYVADPVTSVVSVLPPGLDPLLGIYVNQMGPICANGLLHASAELVGTAPSDPEAVQLADGVRGRKVLVTGGGVVGLLTGLFALSCGAAEVALADPDPQRLSAAEGLGLTPVADDGAESVWRWVHLRVAKRAGRHRRGPRLPVPRPVVGPRHRDAQPAPAGHHHRLGLLRGGLPPTCGSARSSTTRC